MKAKPSVHYANEVFLSGSSPTRDAIISQSYGTHLLIQSFEHHRMRFSWTTLSLARSVIYNTAPYGYLASMYKVQLLPTKAYIASVAHCAAISIPLVVIHLPHKCLRHRLVHGLKISLNWKPEGKLDTVSVMAFDQLVEAAWILEIAPKSNLKVASTGTVNIADKEMVWHYWQDHCNQNAVNSNGYKISISKCAKHFKCPWITRIQFDTKEALTPFLKNLNRCRLGMQQGIADKDKQIFPLLWGPGLFRPNQCLQSY